MATSSSTVTEALRTVLPRVQQAAERCGRVGPHHSIRVVAVSKTKPVSLIRQLYDAGHRCFGENYVQELIEKAPQLPEDIEWHFIGNLQSNKVKPLLTGVPNLAYLESVDDEKIANRLNNFVASIGRQPLKVFIQVNTSGEECKLSDIYGKKKFVSCCMNQTVKFMNVLKPNPVCAVIINISQMVRKAAKSGVEPSGCVELAKYISENCPNLELCGLMTIGMPDYTSTPENFKALANCRTEVSQALGLPEEKCELSMGMSSDFEQAIEMGSTNVRIGSIIFGPREYPKKA